jgi:hypothetical protein
MLHGDCHERAFVRQAGNTADPRGRTKRCNVSLTSGGSKLRLPSIHGQCFHQHRCGAADMDSNVCADGDQWITSVPIGLA